MIYRSAAVIERPREIGLSEGDLRLRQTEHSGLKGSGRVEVIILFVNPGPLINTICAPLQDTVKGKETHTHNQGLFPVQATVLTVRATGRYPFCPSDGSYCPSDGNTILSC